MYRRPLDKAEVLILVVASGTVRGVLTDYNFVSEFRDPTGVTMSVAGRRCSCREERRGMLDVVSNVRGIHSIRKDGLVFVRIIVTFCLY